MSSSQKILLLNLSQHLLVVPPQFNIVEIPVQFNFELTDDNGKILNFISSKFEELFKINPNIKNLILMNKFVIILPGHSALASSFLAFLHGLTGSFPNILYTIRNADSTFSLINNPVNLNDIRASAREFFRTR